MLWFIFSCLFSFVTFEPFIKIGTVGYPLGVPIGTKFLSFILTLLDYLIGRNGPEQIIYDYSVDYI